MIRWYFLSFALLLAGRALAQPIATANFNTGLNPGWTIVDGGTTADTWYVTTGGGFNGNTLNGTNFAFVNSDAAGNSTTIILSEQLKSPIFNGNAYSQVFLEFDHYYRDYSQDTGWVEVYNGSAWIPLANYSANTGAWSAPAHELFNLTPYRNPNMQVRFRYEDNNIWAWYWAVDNVQLYAPPANDASITALNTPTGACGLSNAEPISIEVRNDGTAAITSLPVRYRVNGGPVVNETITANIPAGGTFAYTFTTPVNMSAAGRYTFDAWTNLASDADHSGDSIIGLVRKNHIRITSFPYHQDFEGGQGGWFADGTNSTWAYGTPNKTVIQGAASGTKAWTTGGLTGDYVNFETSQLEGPCFDLTALPSPWFGTDVWWNAEWSWDGAVLQTSVDGGVTWNTVGAYGDPYNWYNDNTIDAAPGGQNDGWTGRAASGDGSGDYVRAVHSLSNWSADTEVILRLAFATDNTVVDDGIAFDDITIASQPVLYLGPDTIACDSLVLDGGPASQYAWSTGDSSQTYVVTQSGTYHLQIRDPLWIPGGRRHPSHRTRRRQLDPRTGQLFLPSPSLYPERPARCQQLPVVDRRYQRQHQRADQWRLPLARHLQRGLYGGGQRGLGLLHVKFPDRPAQRHPLPGRDQRLPKQLPRRAPVLVELRQRLLFQQRQPCRRLHRWRHLPGHAHRHRRPMQRHQQRAGLCRHLHRIGGAGLVQLDALTQSCLRRHASPAGGPHRWPRPAHLHAA